MNIGRITLWGMKRGVMAGSDLGSEQVPKQGWKQVPKQGPKQGSKQDPRQRPAGPLTAAALALVLAGCQSAGGPSASSSSPAAPLAQGYTCCNLHYTDDWISDSNYGNLPMIPLGTPAKVNGYGRYRVLAEVGGKPMRFGLDYGRSEALDQFAAKLVVAEDPKRKLATFPANIQRAITAGQIMPGMTREQVLMSVGYPLTSENPSLSSPVWRMWLGSFEEYQVVWDNNGRVRDVTASASTLTRILYKP